MGDTASKEPIEEVVRKTIGGNAGMVQKWIDGQPGSWGYLAGQAVIAYRRALGRTLTDWERREMWHRLWESLTSQDL